MVPVTPFPFSRADRERDKDVEIRGRIILFIIFYTKKKNVLSDNLKGVSMNVTVRH